MTSGTEKCVLYTRSSKDRADISPAAQKSELISYAQERAITWRASIPMPRSAPMTAHHS
jgi:hypothetical protein